MAQLFGISAASPLDASALSSAPAPQQSSSTAAPSAPLAPTRLSASTQPTEAKKTGADQLANDVALRTMSSAAASESKAAQCTTPPTETKLQCDPSHPYFKMAETFMAQRQGRATQCDAFRRSCVTLLFFFMQGPATSCRAPVRWARLRYRRAQPRGRETSIWKLAIRCLVSFAHPATNSG